ncbi:F-box/WD repeat-containing protein 4-like [Mercenaria mercenaria]|uniref:F-box/WD repeat-containing protein 4-like n=1 Tax=Mercenaria mercenaria TaxID=6596 RepID=UPI00234F6ACE|nr:F-box/WD repeat-containing protein 4-like [Mercenaria mercenaria]
MAASGAQELPLEGGNICSQQDPGTAMSTRARFMELPDDVLYAVLQKCDIKTLCRLCQVCCKLNILIQSDSVWLPYRNLSTVIGSSAVPASTYSLHNRPINSPCVKEQLRLSHNWVEKKYHEKVLCRLNPRQLPWMQYTGGTIWFSVSNTIRCYRIQSDGRIREDKKQHLTLQDPKQHGRQQRRRRANFSAENNKHPNLINKDVSRFVVKDNVTISGCRDGSLYVFDCDSGRCLESIQISVTRDRTVKILAMSHDDSDNNPVRATIDMKDRIWSVAMATNGQSFTVGTSGCKGSPSLSVWDAERAERIFSLGSYRYGAGVLDMKYEDNNTLLTCGYDATLRMWDMRSGRCVEEWQEPYDTTLYCVQTDRNVTMVTGTARYGMIRLWDKRKSEPVQEYFLSQKSPVYSVAFDCSRMYAALDMSINTLDFSVLPT